MVKFNNFTKVNILILLLLFPVLIMYTLSYRTDVDVLQRQIRDSQMSRLSYLYSQLDANVRQLSTMASVLLKDPTVKEFRDMDLYGDEMNVFKTEQVISQKLNLQSVANTFNNSVVIYAPRIGKAMGQFSLVPYDRETIEAVADPHWHYDGRTGEFVMYAFDPVSERNLAANANLIAKVVFTSDNIVKMLDNYHSNDGGTLLYNPADGFIIRSSGDLAREQAITAALGAGGLEERGSRTMKVDRERYLINYVRSDELGWYLVDYVPLQQILSPITANRRYFYIFIGILLLVSLLISYVLHRNIRIPIKELIRSVRELKMGNYSVRLSMRADNEFTYLFRRFNEMAEEIENLVDHVYAERIRSREATLKQLQSQINPHFLYNCLAFMKSMAVLEEKEAIIAMSVSLSKYYRYTTRNERQLVAVREELELVGNYLNIQQLQMKRLRVTMDIPGEILDLPIPRLLLQPVVENAILHGIEPHSRAGKLIVRGVCSENWNQLIVEDDGGGLTEEERLALAKKINMPLDDEIGCGLWNVHQRLRHQFAEGSGLSFEDVPSGGLRVVIRWS
ncbi:sensor histidine kinase [Paenibacillus donghaensis]|uniref:cache domain-containing sensor histidine kinase n=1 Tax=Paenibacillus donghaensis TaxID=414771 RepID=UPI0018838BC9|nr:sensor histidine kinase [Paenibacillus donghaensis]MBE9918098.1 sensor histidine kinase [Paenibacillus donghaensis]